MISDKSLYASFLQGDLSSFETLVIRYRLNLVYFLMQYVNNFETAEDISQDVFAYIYCNPERYDDSYSFKTYVFMLGKRRAIDYLRKESNRLTQPLEEAMISDQASLEKTIFKMEDIAYLKAHIQKLKPEYRQIITLIDLNGFSIAEAAKIMDKSVTSIKVLSHRARNRLKQTMIKGGFTYEV